MSTLHELALVAWSLAHTARLSPEDRRPELCRRMRATPLQLEALLSEARDNRLIDGTDTLQLTKAGAYMAREIDLGLKDVRRQARTSTQSYLGYAPKRWYPDRRSVSSGPRS